MSEESFEFIVESAHRARRPVVVLLGRLWSGRIRVGQMLQVPLVDGDTVRVRIIDFDSFKLRRSGVLPAKELSAAEVTESFGSPSCGAGTRLTWASISQFLLSPKSWLRAGRYRHEVPMVGPKQDETSGCRVEPEKP